MRPFLHSHACRSRAHCPTCRTDPAWRARVGAPDECPHGVTADRLLTPVEHKAQPPWPPPQADPQRWGPQREQALLRLREPICNACDAHGAACEIVFPQVKGCNSPERYRAGHLAWLATPTSRCPRGKWAGLDVQASRDLQETTRDVKQVGAV